MTDAASHHDSARPGTPRQAMAAVRTAVGMTVFVVVTIFSAAGVLIASAIRKDGPAIQRIARIWSRAFLAVAPVRLDIAGRERLDPDTRYMYVANHQSNFDIPVMFLTAPQSIRFMAKKEIFRIPLLAQAMTAMGMIQIDRTAGGRTHSLINEGVAAAVARGHSILTFPEGTRMHDGNLGEFRKGAFRLAISNDLPVVPVTIDGAGAAWPPGSKVVRPGHVRVTVHEPIPTADLPITAITALRNQAKQAIGSALGGN